MFWEVIGLIAWFDSLPEMLDLTLLFFTGGVFSLVKPKQNESCRSELKIDGLKWIVCYCSRIVSPKPPSGVQ